MVRDKREVSSTATPTQLLNRPHLHALRQKEWVAGRTDTAVSRFQVYCTTACGSISPDSRELPSCQGLH